MNIKAKMVKNLLGIFIFSISIILIFGNVSALSFSGLDDTYNLGDDLSFSIDLDQTNNILSLELLCNSKSELVYKQYVNKNNINIIQPLEEKFLSNIPGVGCKLVASFGESVFESKVFVISKDIDIVLAVSQDTFNPGWTLEFEATAIKPNTQGASGFFEAYLQGTDLSLNETFSGGDLGGAIGLPENLRAGEYVFYVNVYEKDSQGKISNRGHATQKIVIRQVPKNLDIILEKQEFTPGEKIKYKAFLTDQSEEQIFDEDVDIIISDPDEEEVLNKVIKSGLEEEFETETNSSEGDWEIILEYSDFNMTKERIFSLSSLKLAEFKIKDNELIVKNIGNVPYDGSVDITIGEETITKNLNLGLGESKKFKLKAPDGTYSVFVGDNLTSFSKPEVVLTGNTISVDNAQGFGLFRNYPLFLLFLIIVFSMVLFMYLKKKEAISLRGIASRLKKKKTSAGSAGKIPVKEVKKQTVDLKNLGKVPVAEHTLVKDGQKQNVSMFALKIKNFNEVRATKTNALDNIIDSLKSVEENKGAVYRSDDVIVGIFAPSLTKTFKNEKIATKAASEVLGKLKEHNSKFKQKIDFGIGVNSGHLILKKTPHKVEFTNIGNTLPLSKKIAEIAEKDILLSKDIHEKIMPEIKSEKKHGVKGVDVYKITRIVEREEHKEFLQKFLKRNP